MKRTITLFCLLCYAFCAFSQADRFVLQEIDFPKRFTDRIVTHIKKDKSGLLWFSTNNGLYRYDGNEVIHFNAESTPALQAEKITRLFVDNDSHLWIGTTDGLTRFTLTTWRTKRMPTSDVKRTLHIASIAQGLDGTIYAGTTDGRFFRVVGDSLEIILDIKASYPLHPANAAIISINEPVPGQLWLSTEMGKLIRIRIKNENFEPPEYFGLKEFQNGLGKAIFGPSGKCLLSVNNGGIYTYDIKTNIFKKIRRQQIDGLGEHGEVFIQKYGKDQVLLLTNEPSIGKEKLFIYDFLTDRVEKQLLHYPDYLKNNHIKWLQNTGNSVLLSMNMHLMELAPKKSIFSIFSANAMGLNSIRSIFKYPGGDLYMGSYKDGLVRLNEANGEQEIIARKYVYAIYPWNADSLLLGTEGDGLFWFEPQSEKLSPLHIRSVSKNAPPPEPHITVIRRVNRQSLLVGTYKGLFLVNPYTQTSLSVAEGRLKNVKIYSLTRQGNQWLVGTVAGLFEWNGHADTVRPIASDTLGRRYSGLVSGTVLVGNQIWIGTKDKGILVANKEGVITDTISRESGLAGNVIYSLLTVGKYIIAGTYGGLSMINKETGVIQNYSRIDGLPSNEFNSGAFFKTGDTVYLGTINGVVRFRADDIGRQNQYPIPIQITDLTIANDNGVIGHNYALPYHKNTMLIIAPDVSYFSIGLGGMNKSTERLRYYYRLKNNGSWKRIGQTKEISFISMPPGNYKLQLSVRMPDGQWTSTLLSLPLIVKPTFYQTLWFKVLIILVIMLLIWSIFKYREKQKEKERLLRLQIAGDLHDEVGSTLAGISMRADMLLSGRREHLTAYLENIADSGRMAVHTMGDIVWSIDPRNDASMSLLHRMKRYGRKILEPADILIVFHARESNEQKYVSQKFRQNTMLIFKEALTNITKYAGASRVDVTFITTKNGLKLIIADNGKGLPKDYTGGHGLRNMQMRANAIGAELYFPEVEKGFTVVLKVKNPKTTLSGRLI